MTTDRGIAPGVRVVLEARLGDRARPARGRPATIRRTFSICAVDELEQTRANGAARLELITGPLRCTPVDVTVAVGTNDTAELLADLSARGVDPDVLRRLVTHYGRIAAAADSFGRGPACLLVSSCGTLTAQAHASVPYS